MQLNPQHHKFSRNIVHLVQVTFVLIAISFPFFHQNYIIPLFEEIILKSAEEDATKVTKYLTHSIFQKSKEDMSLTDKFKNDVFNMKKLERERLNDAVHYFGLWKIKFFNSDGKVIFSTMENEIGTVNTKPYFQSTLALGEIYRKTTYRKINPTRKASYFAEVYVPIMENDAFIGVLEVYYDLSVRKERTDAVIKKVSIMFVILSFVSIVAMIAISLILNKLRQSQTGYQKDLLNLASQDSLTKLLNRESINFNIEQAIQKHTELEINYSLLMFDIDHFKKVNDVHGHQAGDDVLIKLAKIISNRVRASDMVGRYGGEEFIILLPGTNGIGSKVVAENIRRVVEETTISTCAGELNITISIGAGSFSDIKDLNPHNLVKEVDQAMYKSKQNGRNMVTYIQPSHQQEV